MKAEKLPDSFKRSRLFWPLDILGMILIILGDQFLKLWIRDHISAGQSLVVIPGVFSISNLQNTGAAWSILSGHSVLFFLIAVIALAALGVLIYRFRNHHFIVFAFSLIVAGTIGNLIDRLAFGSVCDMFSFTLINFPTFNVADSCISIGVFLLIMAIIFDDKDRG